MAGGSNMPTIHVELPDNRWQAGSLRVEDDQGKTLAGPFAALGRADKKIASDKNNEFADPMLPYGDTPLGTYSVDGFRAASDSKQAIQLGPNDRIELTPTGGEALAAKFRGRTVIQIHGGKPRSLLK